MDDAERDIGIATVLNLLFVVVEVVAGLWTNSLALLSEALHDFGDSIALLTSWFLERAAGRDPDRKRTFGYQRLSLLSAVVSATLLIAGSLFILSQAIPRLLDPEPVNASGMLLVAVIGVVVNGIGFSQLRGGETVNEDVLSWHMLEDVLGWIVILIGAGFMYLGGSPIVDPVMTVGITTFVLYGVGKNVRKSFNIFLQGVPRHIDIDAVEDEVTNLEGVQRVHDVHIWSLEGETDVFTGHVVCTPAALEDPDGMRKQVKDVLDKHHIEHSTIELESPDFCSGIECRE